MVIDCVTNPVQHLEADGGCVALDSILIAEDNPLGQITLEVVLKRHCSLVVIVANGREAITAANSAYLDGRPFSLIVMDLRLPVMDGVSAIRQLRQLGNRSPILAISAAATSDFRTSSLEAGADEYLSKPFSYTCLWRAFQGAMDGAARRLSNSESRVPRTR